MAKIARFFVTDSLIDRLSPRTQSFALMTVVLQDHDSHNIQLVNSFFHNESLWSSTYRDHLWLYYSHCKSLTISHHFQFWSMWSHALSGSLTKFEISKVVSHRPALFITCNFTRKLSPYSELPLSGPVVVSVHQIFFREYWNLELCSLKNVRPFLLTHLVSCDNFKALLTVFIFSILQILLKMLAFWSNLEKNRDLMNKMRLS